MRPGALAVFTLVLLLAGLPAARADGPSAEAEDSAYQEGLSRSAEGDRAGALAAFRESKRRNPDDPFSRAAVRRVEAELARADVAAPRPARPEPRSRLERLLLIDIPRWYHFDRTVGDCLSAVGTQQALNARVRQLLVERRVCRAAKRRCSGDRRLRELIRRAPLAARNSDDV